MPSGNSTIIAHATAIPSNRALIRISGPDVPKILCAFGIKKKHNRGLATGHIKCFNNLVPVTLFCYKENKTVTGEPIAEILVPGGSKFVSLIIQEILKHEGIYKAEPGEFSRRALENKKMTLKEVTEIAYFAAAEGRAAYAALESARLKIAKEIDLIQNLLIQASSAVEANCDFSDEEDIVFITQEQVKEKLNEIKSKINLLLKKPFKKHSSEHPTIELQGLPSSGKSTLFNTLLKTNRTVTHNTKGTTKDNISGHCKLLNGQTINLIDTPGTSIKKLKRTHYPEAGHFVVSCQSSLELQAPPVETLCVATMTDLAPPPSWAEVGICAPLGKGINALEQKIISLIRESTKNLSMETFEIEALKLAKAFIEKSITKLSHSFQEEMIAEDLRHACLALSFENTWDHSDVLFDQIFSKFCIGK